MQILFKLKNGKKEELTMDEARVLYEELHQLFGKPAPALPIPNWPYARPFNPLDNIGVPRGTGWPPAIGPVISFTGNGEISEAYGPINK